MPTLCICDHCRTRVASSSSLLTVLVGPEVEAAWPKRMGEGEGQRPSPDHPAFGLGGLHEVNGLLSRAACCFDAIRHAHTPEISSCQKEPGVPFQGSTDLIQSLGMAEGELRQCFSSMQDPGEDGLAVHSQDSLQLVVNLLDSFLIRNLGSFVSAILDGTSKQHGVGGATAFELTADPGAGINNGGLLSGHDKAMSV